MDFGTWLKGKRTARKLSQRALAKYARVSNSQVSMYERGEAFPDPDTVETLAKYFEVEPSELEGFRPRKARPLGLTGMASPNGGIDARQIYPTIQAIFGSATRLTEMLMEWGTPPDQVPDVLKGLEGYVEEHGRPPTGVGDYDPSPGDLRQYPSPLPVDAVQVADDSDHSESGIPRPRGAG